MATADMQMDSRAGEAWCEAVERINEKVSEILQQVTQILEDLGKSDEGGTIGTKIVRAAQGYLQKYGDMIAKFIDVVAKVAEFIGKVVAFATGVSGTLSTIAKLVDVII